MNRFPSSNVWTGVIRKAVALRTAIMKWLVPPRQVKADHPMAVATVAAAVIGGRLPCQLHS
jgi:hypothetical protein